MRCLDGITNSMDMSLKFEQVLGVGDGQGSLACCSPWGCKESDMTEQLNNNNIPTMECHLALRRMEIFLNLFLIEA